MHKAPKAICIYFNSKEKIAFKILDSFIKNNFGFVLKTIKLKEDIVKTRGLLFSPIETRRALEKVKTESGAVEIIISDRLIATYEDSDKRLHLRAVVFSYPSVISTSGIVEGPAKPKGYYLLKHRYSLLKVWELKEGEVKKQFRGRFIDYGDWRLTEVLKGYISQAIFFELTGRPFCKNKSCRLFNSHWQEDLIRAQVKSGEFCRWHKKEIEKMRDGISSREQ